MANPSAVPPRRGRPPGAPNKSTASVKDALNKAFSGKGGQASFNKWAKDNETEFYKLWAKMLPADVNANVTGAITVNLMPMTYVPPEPK